MTCAVLNLRICSGVHSSWTLPAKSLWNKWNTGTVIILLAVSALEEVLPILSGIVLPLLDGGRGGVADTARLDCDFNP